MLKTNTFVGTKFFDYGVDTMLNKLNVNSFRNTLINWMNTLTNDFNNHEQITQSFSNLRHVMRSRFGTLPPKLGKESISVFVAQQTCQ